MSTGGLFEDLRPFELGDRSAPLQGRVSLSRFTRFAPLIAAPNPGDASATSDVHLDLRFALADERRCRVTGSVRTRGEIVCQRCAERVVTDIRAEINLTIVRNEVQARALANSEDVLVEVQPMTIEMLLEDDLIMALPEYGCDVEVSCPRRPPMVYGEIGDASESASPFAGLKGLLQGKDQ